MVSDGGNIVADDNCRRIEWLTATVLKKICSDYSGWETLYQNPEDGRYWELTYPESGYHGGGPPSLRNITGEMATTKYKMSEDIKVGNQNVRQEKMKEIEIEEIKIDEENRLLVRPKISPDYSYEYIYRDASGITWINKARSLAAREPEKWNHFDLFKQIIAAVQSEYGDFLQVSVDTRWVNIPTALATQIREWKRS